MNIQDATNMKMFAVFLSNQTVELKGPGLSDFCKLIEILISKESSNFFHIVPEKFQRQYIFRLEDIGENVTKLWSPYLSLYN